MIVSLSQNGALELTAYATAGLGVVTAGLAFATFGMVRLTRQTLRQNRDEIELAKSELQEAHRPIVMPTSTSASVARTDNAAMAPGWPSATEGVLTVPVQNIGAGPAIQVELTIRKLRPFESEKIQFEKRYDAPAVPALGIGERLAFEFTITGLEKAPWFAMTLKYRDVGGKQWSTKATWVEPAVYEGLRVTAMTKSLEA